VYSYNVLFVRSLVVLGVAVAISVAFISFENITEHFSRCAVIQKAPRMQDKTTSSAHKIWGNRWVAAAGAYSAPLDPRWWEGGWLPLLQNPTPLSAVRALLNPVHDKILCTPLTDVSCHFLSL